MKVQHTNQTTLKSIAMDNARFMFENVENGMSIDEAVEAYADGMMEDMFDEDEFDAPYDLDQVKPILREALVSYITDSATEIRNYAAAHPAAYVRDYDDENEIGEHVVVRVIAVDGEEFHVVYSEDDDLFYHNQTGK